MCCYRRCDFRLFMPLPVLLSGPSHVRAIAVRPVEGRMPVALAPTRRRLDSAGDALLWPGVVRLAALGWCQLANLAR